MFSVKPNNKIALEVVKLIILFDKSDTILINQDMTTVNSVIYPLTNPIMF